MRLFKKKNDSIIRTKIITEKDIKGRWPFIVSEIKVYCMAGTSVYCEIKGRNYALNGFSHDVLKLTQVLDTKLVKTEYIKGEVVKYPTTEIIEIGLNLFTKREVHRFRNIHQYLNK